jgi:hypothetical protein
MTNTIKDPRVKESTAESNPSRSNGVEVKDEAPKVEAPKDAPVPTSEKEGK